MAFPQIESRLTQQFTSATTTYNVNMPANVVAGNLLIIILSKFETESISAPTGWTADASNSYRGPVGPYCAVFYKVADGSESGTSVSATTGTARAAAAIVVQISAWEGTIVSPDGLTSGVPFAQGSSSTATPSCPTADWGVADNLFLAFAAAADDDATFNSAPTNYINLTQVASGAGTNLGAEAAIADRELTADTDTPDAFALSESEGWVSSVVIIKPGTSGGSPNTTAPTFTSAPTAVNISGTSFDIQSTIDEDGTIYSVVLADGATAPTSEEVKAGTGSGGAAAVDSGSTAATGGTQATISHTGLTAGTAYDVYVVAEDDEATPNLQSSPSLVNVTTTITSVTTTITDVNGNALANETGIEWAWSDTFTGNPTDTGTGETTDGSGVMVVDVPNTGLSSGQTGYLSVKLSSGNVGISAESID